MADASPFTITELSGSKRSIELVGRALPYRPFTLGSAQRVTLRWNAGSPVATSTILGAMEKPSNVRGMWKDKYLNAGPGVEPPFSLQNTPVLSASEAVKILDSICQEGSQLRVSWLTVVRIGFLEEFEVSWENSNDVAWSMSFVWVSRGQAPGPVAFATQTTMGDSVSRARSAFDLLDQIRLPDNFGLFTEFTQTLVGLVNGLQNLIFNLEDGLANLVRKVTNPIQAVRGLVAILKSVGTEAKLVRDFLYSQVPSAMIGTTTTSPPQEDVDADPGGTISPAQRMEAARYQREMVAWANELRRLSNELASQMDVQVNGDLLATYLAQDLDDLREVSLKYYGTPYEWRRLMVFNNLASAELIAGQIVLIPQLNAGQGSQLGGGA